LGLYDGVNLRYLAGRDWIMTFTYGRDPGPTRPVTHPRAFGSFTKKIRDLVLDEGLLTLPYTVRSMTGLAADFLGWSERGYLREGYMADITVLNLQTLDDLATYENPHQYSRGTVHVLVNGVFAIRDGEATMALAGRPLVRGGGAFDGE
ncbi:MAG: amidohydrolase family protein, partial [Gemmatimonadetes bacterium]|nr:amidohydrolase family protein [Gemmatimonadota bacterium]